MSFRLQRASQRNVYPRMKCHFDPCSFDNNEIGIQTETRGLSLNLLIGHTSA